MDSMHLLAGNAPVLVLIFLGFLLLVVVCILFWRTIEDLRKTVTRGQEEHLEAMGALHMQLEDLIRAQFETLNTVKSLAGNGRAPAGKRTSSAPGPAPSAPAQRSAKPRKGLGNITDFILDEE